jgi:hypothetical protein
MAGKSWIGIASIERIDLELTVAKALLSKPSDQHP